MTTQEYAEAVVKERLREKVRGKLAKNFPGADCEESVSYAFYKSAKRVEDFKSTEHLASWLYETAMFDMTQRKREERNRLRLRRQLLRVSSRAYDPFRRLDWRIDLEKALHRSVSSKLLQDGLRAVIVAGFTEDEVAERLASRGGRKFDAWEKALKRAKIELRAEMRRMGYRKLR